MTKSVNHLEQLAILQIDFDIWSGQVKLNDPDLKLGVGGEIPPKQLVDLGRKNVIDKAHLKPFNRLKTSARRLCLRHGMPFMNGFAVPLDRIDEISAGLEEVVNEMNDLKANFLANYDRWIGDWEQKNPDYAQAIRAGKLPKAVVERRIGFDYQVFQVTPVNEAHALKLNGMANGLADELLNEIVDEADSFFQSNLKGKEECQVTTQKTLKRLRDKVDGLSFLDSRFLSVVELLTKTINGYPSTGKIVGGEQYFRIMSATLILTSKTKIQEYASGTVDLDQMANSYISNSQAVSQKAHAKDSNPPASILSEESSSPLDLTLPDDDELDQIFGSKVANGTSSYF